jgi:DNA-binding XRE family transcriptional regulator
MAGEDCTVVADVARPVAQPGRISSITTIMPTTPFSSALKAKQKEGKLSIAAMAKAIGANSQSVTAALKGKSVPNKTTAPKFAKFLGISIEEFQAMSKPVAKAVTKAKPAKKGKKSKRAKAAKTASVTVASMPVKAAKVKSVTLAEAVELAADALAVATHRATAAQRKIIVAVLGG